MSEAGTGPAAEPGSGTGRPGGNGEFAGLSALVTGGRPGSGSPPPGCSPAGARGWRSWTGRWPIPATG